MISQHISIILFDLSKLFNFVRWICLEDLTMILCSVVIFDDRKADETRLKTHEPLFFFFEGELQMRHFPMGEIEDEEVPIDN